MKKKIALGIAAAGGALALLPLFAAFEAHVINVTATIENALELRTTNEIQFGTVFPEEVLHQPMELALSGSFLAEDRVDDVEYMIRQKPKCGLPVPNSSPVSYSAFGRVVDDGDGGFVCEDAGYVQLPLLCPFLSKHPDGTPVANDGSLNSFHGPLTNWTLADTVSTQVLGKLSKLAQDTLDTWDIDLDVPCFSKSCAQDNKVPPQYQLDPADEHKLFGCDLWVEVTNVSEKPQTGSVTVTKVIVPLSGQPATLLVSDFNLFVSATQVTSGATNNFATNTYTISETPVGSLPPYSTSISCNDPDFVDNGNTGDITLQNGEAISCTITNTELDI